jgi:hypothetical protein
MRVKANFSKTANQRRPRIPSLHINNVIQLPKFVLKQGASVDRGVGVCCLQPGHHRVLGGRLYVRLMTLSNALSKLIQHYCDINFATLNFA